MVTSELFDVVDRYIQNTLTLEELEDWIVPRLPIFFELPLSQTSEFVAAIELGLAEMSNGSRTEEEFHTLLKQLLPTMKTLWLVYPPGTELASATSANTLSLSALYSPSQTPEYNRT